MNITVTNTNSMAQSQSQTMMIGTRNKSVLVAFLLTLFFGPLGMFYSTVGGAMVMLILSLLLGVVTFGLSIAITWPICIIWGMAAAASSRR